MAVETNVLRDEELLGRLSTAREGLLREIRKAIKGQDEVVEQVLLSLFVGGHSIITGVPGLAKTLLVRTIASVLDLSFKRIQLTPDLMPADITGTEIIEEDRATGRRAMEFSSRRISGNRRSMAVRSPACQPARRVVISLALACIMFPAFRPRR